MRKKFFPFLAVWVIPLTGYCDLLSGTTAKGIGVLLFGLLLILLYWVFAFLSLFDALAVVRNKKTFNKIRTLIIFGLPAVLSSIALISNPVINLIVNLQIVPITLTIVAGLLYILYWFRTTYSIK